MYIIRKKGRRGLYVAKKGYKHSYTTSLFNARKFETKEQAEKEKCGNERIIFLSFFHRLP